jgi:hypothetical protein
VDDARIEHGASIAVSGLKQTQQGPSSAQLDVMQPPRLYSTYRAKASAKIFVQAQKQSLRVLCRLLPRLLSQHTPQGV